ncbi:MAG: hypothetical protein GY694_21890 [Gammaproteobacteria bacterium]|nr:hypothetical protein [Gammaproteobacteria bacterium]
MQTNPNQKIFESINNINNTQYISKILSQNPIMNLKSHKEFYAIGSKVIWKKWENDKYSHLAFQTNKNR